MNLSTVKWQLLLAIFIALTHTSCSSIPPVKDNGVINHVISISRDGELEKIVPGKATPVNRAYQGKRIVSGDFEHILRGISHFPRNKKGEIDVLIYIHGGLNSKSYAMNRVDKSYQRIRDAKEGK